MAVPLFDTRTPVEPLREAIKAKIAEVIDSQRFILGPELEAFEGELAAYLGARHVVGVGNGTDAITLAIPMSPVLSREQAGEVVSAVRDAGLGRPH